MTFHGQEQVIRRENGDFDTRCKFDVGAKHSGGWKLSNTHQMTVNNRGIYVNSIAELKYTWPTWV